ncbi:MAG TPA: hypothetical protein VMF30_12025 [Pirellulales bacterium]|nr:hypothetical protein [Pirellulales bacterium]
MTQRIRIRLNSIPLEGALLLLAALCALGLLITTAAAQSNSSTGPGSTNPGLQGTGPRVDVQNSANATLDINAGAGTDLNMTGENFRGNFGAARIQPGPSPTTNLPRSSFPAPTASPDFNPSLPGPGAPRGEADAADLNELILPRFRGALAGAAERPTGEGWRYRYFNRRWWYWQPNESWLYWDGARWQSFASRQ